jgi:(+)-trans-carveol dehydrogenase
MAANRRVGGTGPEMSASANSGRVGSARFDGRVVFISGVARGQGRQHAIGFAREGANVIGLDILEDIETALAPVATPDDLAETARLVEAAGGKLVASRADARDFGQVEHALQLGLDAFGRVDVVVANAGICSELLPFWQIDEESWRATVDTNLTGVWHTVKAAVPAMIAADNGGAVVLTGSVAAGKGMANLAPYCSAKHGLVGLMRVMAIDLAEYGIRANVVSPTNVDTPMFMNDVVKATFAGADGDGVTVEQFEEAAGEINLLATGWVEPEDVSAAVRWLASDEARYVTGQMLAVDAGALTR